MKNKIIVITGPSGSGKTTISNLILSFDKNIEKAKSVSTREKRDEQDDSDYNFISSDLFKDKIINDELIEFEEVYGNYYGTLKSEINRILSKNKTPLLVLNVKGAITLKKLFNDDCISIFLNTSNRDILKDRLLKRNVDSNLSSRLEKAEFEISLKAEFDYEVVNDDFFQSFEKIKNIIENDLYSELRSKTLIVNMLGGPGTGKSSMASGVFSKLKWLGVEAEIVYEYAKELVWSGHFNGLKDQIDIFGNQHTRNFRLLDQVDVIVTDSPLLLQLIYSKNKYLNDLILNIHKTSNNLDILVDRVKPYNPKGRTQTLEEAIELDKDMKSVLDTHNQKYYRFDGCPESEQKIVDLILNTLNSNK